MPSTLANVLSQNLTSVITSVLFNVKTLGLYSFGLRIIGSPSMLIGKAFSQVYISEASKQRREYGNATQVFNNTLKKLLIISVPIFIIAFFVIEEVFAFVFGEQWRVAGIYAQILIPLFWAKFVTAPISVTNSVFEKQKISLYWQVGLLIISLLIFLFTYLVKLKFETFLYYYSGILTLYYVFFIFILKKVSRGQQKNYNSDFT
jgi:O-antigen/teichoic acid export membrane protein